MRNRRAFEQQRRSLLAMVLALPALAACSGQKLFKWEEEVILGSGETLLLERTTRYRRMSEPFNPLQSGWGEEGSTLVVRQGPDDLVGARYGQDAWLYPVVLDRDPRSRQLVLILTAFNCDWLEPYKGKNRSIYVAFAMMPGISAVAIDFPDWAWNRERNLYKPFVHIEPPKRVTPAQTKEHNATKAQGAREYFTIDPNYKSQRC